MDDSQLDRTPNPFSAFAKTRTHSRQSLLSAIKLLVVAALLFAAITFAQSSLHQSQLSSLLDRFSGQPTDTKLEQLRQLQANGVLGIDGIVAAVTDEDRAVADAAVAALLSLDRQWMTLPSEELSRNRLAVAVALDECSEGLADPANPGHARIQDYARLTAQKLINESGAANEQAYETLMKLVNRRGHKTPAPVGQELASSEPLPIDLVDHADAAWTDWPPTSTRPSLLSRQSVSVETLGTNEIAMHQVDDEGASGARLLKPQFRVAETLADQRQSGQEPDVSSQEYWTMQLASPSRLVRMRAAKELAQFATEESVLVLQKHLEREGDPEIKALIGRQLANE